MSKDLATIVKEKKIKYVLFNFVDLFGNMRAKLVPAPAVADMQIGGAGFAGFASHLDMSPADPDMFAIPDADSFIQLPWQLEVGWVACDLWMHDKPVEASPRVILKRQIERAKAKGWRMKTGVECEFFIVNRDGSRISDDLDTQAKPCYDQSALMRQFDLISEICDAMIKLGWGPYQNDHEDANGQFEMNWDFDDAMITADRHAFFKFMAKTIAEKHGLRITFMPKPFLDLTGNGCHAHVSLWDKSGKKCLFLDRKDDLGISRLGYHFLGGVIDSADALCALFTPTINSFKRINAPVTSSGATWAPNTVTYTGNNRTHMVRIPDAGRFELRLMDGAANPYMMQAGFLAAGIDGVANKSDPGKPLHINMYEEGQRLKRVKRLPLNLLDALRLMAKSKMLREAFGKEVVDSYVKLRMREWDSFMGHASTWERENTLDC